MRMLLHVIKRKVVSGKSFLDQGYMTEDMLSPDYFRWLYTAFTRATELLYLVNWPEEQTENNL